MFGILVVAYLFLGGCGAGILLVTSLMSLVFYAGRRRSAETVRMFGRLRSHCLLVGTLVLLFSVLCLMGDLGRPDRILYLFARPTPSLLTFGTYILCGTLAVGGFLCATALMDVFWVSGRAKQVGEVVCALLAVCAITYTGMYLQQMKAVAFWDTPLVPALFVLSALSTAMAAILLVWPLTCATTGLVRAERSLRACHAAVMAVELAALAAYVLFALGDPVTARSVDLLLGDELGPWFVAGVFVCGLLAPLMLDALSFAVRRPLMAPLCSLLVLVGGFSLRYCIVLAGLH